jgi:hypothetical protein
METATRIIARWPSLPYVLLALVSCVPLVVVKYLPLQDLPFHLATTRVIHSYSDPTYNFQTDYVLALGRTQYVLYYLLASLLGHVIGLVAANLILIAVYLGGTVLAVRSLVRALGKDDRLCILVVPALNNVMFLFGLLPFLFAIPLMFWALAAAIRYFETRSARHGVTVAILGVALFYSHVFPLALFALGFAALFPWRKPRSWWWASLPMVLPTALVGWWALFTPEGRLARSALVSPERGSPLGPIDKIRDTFNWLGDVYRDLSDETLWGLLAAVAIAATLLGFRERSARPRPAYALVPVACAVLLFLTGEQQGHIWLIWQRFPILLTVTAIPLLRFPRGRMGAYVTAIASLLAVASTANMAAHFVRFERDDVDDFDGALAHMEPNKRVAGLIFDKQSSVTHRHPFVHFVSYYQAAKGGVVEFTFASYPHWPFAFRDDHCPPSGCPVRLNWEWTPEQVTTSELYPYYDYVLTRGPGFDPPKGTFLRTWVGGRWAVWTREPSLRDP